ncbi:MAG TPA: YceI family protein [Candidatus Saccharimonadales bacterium]|jgi:polyisoprenoid-binding protein YceI|nr:YceI family protein [Candidatus Saccharimonadales bacterium]
MDTGTQKSIAKFVIDKTGSRFTVQAFSTGLLSSFGHNPTIAIRDYNGEVEISPDTFEHARVRLNIRTKQMDVLDRMKSDDRKKLEEEMYANVLNVDQFPKASYESTEVSIQKLGGELLVAHVVGELSFHGVQRLQLIDARVTRMATMLRISGQFTLRQTDFGIKPVSFAGGTLKLKDELKFNFELVARGQEQPENTYQA